jgi:hypothetical protein
MAEEFRRSTKPVEFTIEVVRDPVGNTSAQYGLKSADPTVYLPASSSAANLKYVSPAAYRSCSRRNAGGRRSGNQESSWDDLMSDACRRRSRPRPASAIMGHEQAKVSVTQQIEQIVEYESSVYAAQAAHIFMDPYRFPATCRVGSARCAITKLAFSATTTTIRCSEASTRGRERTITARLLRGRISLCSAVPARRRAH